MSAGMALQALLGLPMVCATAFALLVALIAPRVPGRTLVRWGAALMLLGQVGALGVSVGQTLLLQRTLAGGGSLQQAGVVIGLIHMGLGVIAVVGLSLLAVGFLRTARAAAGAMPR
ncbi:hypothetical protein [Pseudoxanthomonas winnipegensis]|uniref:hypothetical protein n=1 Tax=Pseudoxanthomonas winnipegensis TaxID=2480810 RepID=UPI00103E9814|nr:hypothetical protein [Pseudoxanthomonas winnipegensis]TBV74722.1 hypothetical protein EYC45_08310 [Pseudoxanthomonas winnipegensis]